MTSKVLSVNYNSPFRKTGLMNDTKRTSMQQEDGGTCGILPCRYCESYLECEGVAYYSKGKPHICHLPKHPGGLGYDL